MTQLISDRSPEYDQRLLQWEKIRDTIEGEEQIKSKSTCYLPKPSGQNTAGYEAFRARSVFYGVSDRTVRGLVGSVFRIDPQLELPPALETLERFASPDGNTLDTVLREAIREVVSLGRFGVLVDMPAELSLTATPYLASYTAENIWRWEEFLDPVRGQRILTRVVVHEDAIFHQDLKADVLRELFIDPLTGWYTQQLWTKTSNEDANNSNGAGVGRHIEATDEDESGYNPFGEPIVPTVGGVPLNAIPFVFINTCNLSPKPEKPPMLDLANMNIAHYRNSADLEQAIHLTAQPTPWVSGAFEEGEKPTHIGSATIWYIPQGGSAGMMEYTGTGVESISREMKDKEERMAALGARLIRDQERPNVTAETTRLQSRGDQSVLQTSVQNVELGFNKALAIAAAWVGAPEDAARITLNKDFVETRMSPEDLTATVRGWQQGAYSRETMWNNLQRGEVADPRRAVEEEMVRIKAEEAAGTGPGEVGVQGAEARASEEASLREEEERRTSESEETTPTGDDS